jgi:hypothetical protein
MLTRSLQLPPNLKVKLDRLRRDPEFQELLRLIPEPYLPRYKALHSAAGEAEGSNRQKDDWVFASGKVIGHRLLCAYFGVNYDKETKHRDDD